ncbi:MAG TPA: winged helix-turn-helix domain-containing protein [Candidatus Polarisedimenticolia bacterium]|nr:winged helix-turn-helix domain-containing protein [Candidatus Polarisedimenticolia bacterium]
MGRLNQSIGEVEVDLGRYELRRSGRRIKLEKKPMELLIFLLERREQMISRDDIVKKLWRSDLFIDTERNVNNVVRKLRTALGDNADRPRFLETVVGKGYRFVGPVRVIDAKYPSSDSGRSSVRSDVRKDGSERGERSSIAVLPLLLLEKAADDQGLCLGFADALVSLLGNLAGVDVLPTSAVLNLPLELTPSEIASRLGVRFVVHGAIQMSKGQRRLSLEMFDTSLQRLSFTKKCDIDLDRLAGLEGDIAKQISRAVNRPYSPAAIAQRPRYSRDPMAYSEFMRGYRITASGDASMMDQASHHLTDAVTRDPMFALAHATLSFACTTRHFEFDPASVWLEKAEFHCRRALEIDANLPEGHVARAFLLWGPSKNFQHLEAIADLKRALALQNNLPHAYNRLGSILAHIGLLDHSRAMFERGRPFQAKKAVSPSIVQAYVWGQDYDLARHQIEVWRAESPGNKYALYFAPFPAMMTGDWKEARLRIDEALRSVPNEPLIISLEGLFYALTGNRDVAIECVTRACSSPKSFGHAHHTYYQIACTLALTGRRETAFEWLERSVSTGFACWPYFLKDPSLASLRSLPEFELLISALQAKYPDHLGLL